ncbi:hypothetical protein BH09MYX1_BH09MYX1_14380 [soil metagenome]
MKWTPLAFALLLIGCSSVQATAIATGPVHAAPRAGPVAVFASGAPPTAVELGQVEVRGEGEEGSVESLLPVFAQKVAALGGDAAVIDSVDARFELSYSTTPETMVAPCAWRTCINTRYVPTTTEILVVTMKGRAMKTAVPVVVAPPPPPEATP